MRCCLGTSRWNHKIFVVYVCIDIGVGFHQAPYCAVCGFCFIHLKSQIKLDVSTQAPVLPAHRRLHLGMNFTSLRSIWLDLQHFLLPSALHADVGCNEVQRWNNVFYVIVCIYWCKIWKEILSNSLLCLLCQWANHKQNVCLSVHPCCSLFTHISKPALHYFCYQVGAVLLLKYVYYFLSMESVYSLTALEGQRQSRGWWVKKRPMGQGHVWSWAELLMQMAVSFSFTWPVQGMHSGSESKSITLRDICTC